MVRVGVFVNFGFHMFGQNIFACKMARWPWGSKGFPTHQDGVEHHHFIVTRCFYSGLCMINMQKHLWTLQGSGSWPGKFDAFTDLLFHHLQSSHSHIGGWKRLRINKNVLIFFSHFFGVCVCVCVHCCHPGACQTCGQGVALYWMVLGLLGPWWYFLFSWHAVSWVSCWECARILP